MPSRRDAPTRVFLVRHGQSTFNAQQRYQGRSDEPVLTEAGAAAAALTGRCLAAFPFDAVLSSPLRRAFGTARVIAAELPGTPAAAASENLRELDLGAWQGLPIEAVRQRFPEAYREWRESPHELRMNGPDGRAFFPVRDLFDQARRFWREFLARHAGERVLLVTHGGTARALASTATGIGMERFQSLQQSNCGISILEFGPGRECARMEAWNLTAHLGERAPKLKQGKRGLRALLLAAEEPLEAARRNLGALQADFVFTATGELPAAWHAAAQSRVPAAGLATGVFIGPGAVLCGWLSQVLELNGAAPWKPLGAAALHYPGPGHPPVVQSFRAREALA